MVNLNSNLEQGSYLIKEIQGDQKYIEMLAFLGIHKDAEIQILGEGYFPNSIIVLVNDNHLQLNSDFMNRIMVEKVKTLVKR